MRFSARPGGGAEAGGDIGDLHEGARLYRFRGPEQEAFRYELGYVRCCLSIVAVVASERTAFRLALSS